MAVYDRLPVPLPLRPIVEQAWAPGVRHRSFCVAMMDSHLVVQLYPGAQYQIHGPFVRDSQGQYHTLAGVTTSEDDLGQTVSVADAPNINGLLCFSVRDDVP